MTPEALVYARALLAWSRSIPYVPREEGEDGDHPVRDSVEGRPRTNEERSQES